MDEVTIRLHGKPLAEGGYVATSPDVPGLVAQGRSAVEVAQIARGLARKIAEPLRDLGDLITTELSSLVAADTRRRI